LKTPQNGGVLFDRDSTFVFNQKPLINAGIFRDDMRSILLPYIDILRGLPVFPQGAAVVLMNNYSPHVSDDVIRIPHVISVAPHTTQVFQVLDLTLFGVLKRHPRYELPFDQNTAPVKVIMKVYHDFRQIMIEQNPS
jgi:hypothetical protein